MKIIIQNFFGVWRRVKLVHLIFNLFHYDKLKKNKGLYKKYGVNKSVITSVSNTSFGKNKNGSIPWLDKPNAREKLVVHENFNDFSEKQREQLLHWIDFGYMVFPNYFDQLLIEKVNEDIDSIIKHKKLPFHYSNPRIMNGMKYSAAVKQIVENKELNHLFNFIMGKSVRPFQTMNFIIGSEAKAHSDSIHMTTEPLGYLLAIWVALEDVSLESGPLFYYPGSHKLPYVMSQDFETGNTTFMIGNNYYENYTGFIEDKIEGLKLEKKIFQAKKGDVLVWHANLLHGGLPVLNEKLTRKSLVIHYFCDDVVCYHEITQRPAVFEEL